MSVEAVILAGGLSLRMGRDKARLRLGGRSLVTIIRGVCAEAGLDSRVVRRDAVPRCGPIGGVFTALRDSTTDCCLLLSCDMPFIPASWLRRLVGEAFQSGRSVWTGGDGLAGFPVVIWRRDAARVQGEIAAGRFSLQGLARLLEGGIIESGVHGEEFLNINTPGALAEARRAWRARQGSV